MTVESALRELRVRYSSLAFTHTLVADENDLFETERTGIGDFTPRRRIQFAAGRRAARRALAELSVPAVAIPSTDRGVPIFPDGYLGSISHKREWAIAVVGSATGMRSLGIDLELDAESDELALRARVCTSSEVGSVDLLFAAGIQSPASWFLSAKEAVFKAVHPLDGAERDFDDIELQFLGDGVFRVVRLVPETVPVVGAYVHRGRFLVSLAIVPP